MFIYLYTPVVPRPTVSVRDPVTPYLGTNFKLTGVIRLNVYVDTNVTVRGEWSPGNVSEETTASPYYPTDLPFRPLATDSARDYTLVVTVRPSDDSEFILQNNGSVTYPLEVTREFLDFLPLNLFDHTTVVCSSSFPSPHHRRGNSWPLL